jgi:hypothetical protein
MKQTMRNMKLKMATLAIGSVLTLLGPATAAARERDDFHAADRERGRTEQRWNGEDRSRFRNVSNYREVGRSHRERADSSARYVDHLDGDRR